MRVITDLKALRDWQLNKQEDGKSRALLILPNDLSAPEQIQLLRAARARCDFTLAVADVHATRHAEMLNVIADNGCSAVLLWDEKTLYPDSLGIRLQLGAHCPPAVQNEDMQRFAGQLLHLRCLFQPTLTVLEHQHFPKLWLARRLCLEYFRAENITAVDIKPEAEQSKFLRTVLERCSLAIQAGKPLVETLSRGRKILLSRHHQLRAFDCFDREKFLPTQQTKEVVLWAETLCDGEICRAVVEIP